MGLYDNQLTGSIPSEIGNLTNLEWLILDDNELTGIIPDEICNQGDSSPDLDNNQFCPPYPECISPSDIGYQDLSVCGDVVELWGEYYSIEYTTELDLSGSGLTGPIPPEIGNLTNLTKLLLFDNDLVGEIPEEIGQLINLDYLHLRENQLSGAIPAEIGNLINLTKLYLNKNQLTGEIPIEIGNLAHLTKLYLNENQLTGEIPLEIGNLIDLNKLYLNENQITGSIPPEIGYLSNLTGLYLNSNQLSGIIPDEICNQGDSSPNLSNNQLCPPYPSCVEDYVGDQDTSGCGQVSIIDETIPNTYNLYNAYPNPFNPKTTLHYDLPEDAMVNITIYDMMGRIVSNSEIGNLTNLTRLYLSSNQLTSSIPSEIGNLTNLERLWLHNNQLTGVIPESICDLNINWNNSNYFNITNNQLCPPYPSCIEDVGVQDTSGCAQVSIIDETLPIIYNLYNAYPNPFNPVTILRYALPEDGFVNITIYDMMGRVREQFG